MSIQDIKLFTDDGMLILSEETAKAWREHFFPGGSGSLYMMRIICSILDTVAEEKGWDIGQTTRPLNNKTFFTK
jgi:hypothetical protein